MFGLLSGVLSAVCYYFTGCMQSSRWLLLLMFGLPAAVLSAVRYYFTGCMVVLQMAVTSNVLPPCSCFKCFMLLFYRVYGSPPDGCYF